jgi:hypothetical protein
MLDPVLRADPVEDVLHRMAILFAVCELEIEQPVVWKFGDGVITHRGIPT